MTAEHTKALGVTIVAALYQCVVIISSGWLWSVYGNTRAVVIGTGLALLLGAALLTFALSLIKNNWHRLALIAAPVLATIAAGQVALSALVAALLMIPFLLSAANHLTYERENHRTYRPRHLFATGSHRVVAAVCLSVLGILYPLLNPLFDPANIRLTSQEVEYMIALSAPFLPVGTPAAPASAYALMAEALNQYIQRLLNQNPLIVPLIALALAIYLLRATTSLLAWPVVWLTGVLVALARRAGLLRLITVTEPLERLTL